jgi:hypothetical protein
VLRIRENLVQIRIWIHTFNYRIRMRNREAQKHKDPTDPEHWYIYIILQR